MRSAARPLQLLTAFSFAACASAGTDPWAPPAGYYDSATGTGAMLKSQLYDRMRLGHFQRDYGDFRYSAALHDADPNDPTRILLVYNRASVSGTWTNGNSWNREHVWPQSLQPGSASNSTTGNLGDPHALRPANPGINSSRGNRPFGFETTTGSYGFQGAYYFVGDADKGDIARSLFYSDTRWGPERGLSLTDVFPSGNRMGDLSSLIAWHYLDTPDEFERRRNHVISSITENPSYFTNNRNAYTDRPEYVWSVYMDQANDSRLWVGGGADADGASLTTIDLGGVMIGSAPSATAGVTLHRDGTDGVYYSVTSEGGATCDAEGRYNAFAIDGDASRVLTVGADASLAATAGFHTATVTIDNLDVTDGAGAGRGALDMDDTIEVELTVYKHANASFSFTEDIDVLEFDFGAIEPGDGDAHAFASIANLDLGRGPFAPLDLQLGAATGDTDRLTMTPAFLDDIEAGETTLVTLAMLDGTTGTFSAEYTVRTFDDDAIDGSTEGTPLTIRLTGSVGLPCPADLNNDGDVNASDLAVLLAAWGAPAADLTADGVTNASDLAVLLASWGPCD